MKYTQRHSFDADHYVLSRSRDEQDRLNKQHEYITEAVFDGRLIFKNNTKLRPGMKVLDSATGTGCWILALSKEVDSSISLVGADISSTMFPDSHPRNVQFVETSVTNMPEKWTETFDFINQRFLIAALTATQWVVALKELYRVLKPGGTIQITELHSFNPLGEGLRKSGEVWKKFMSLLEEKGHLSDSGYRIKDFARNAGFENVEESVQRAPIGRRWGKLGEAGAENLKRGLRVLEPTNIGRGGLENVNTCTKSQSLVECARQEWDNCEGLYLSVTVVTARKPL